MYKLRYKDMSDIYKYPGTEVLKNTFDEEEQEELDILEEEITTIMLAKFINDPIKGYFDFEHLKKIHHELFKEIYMFSGEVRVVNISKGGPGFCRFEYINPMSEDIFGKLKKDNYLKGLSNSEFEKKLLYYMGEINALHPFREGNGRTLREFLRTLCLNSGWLLDYTVATKEEILSADIALFNGDETKMLKLFNKGLIKKI